MINLINFKLIKNKVIDLIHFKLIINSVIYYPCLCMMIDIDIPLIDCNLRYEMSDIVVI